MIALLIFLVRLLVLPSGSPSVNASAKAFLHNQDPEQTSVASLPRSATVRLSFNADCQDASY